MRCLKDGHRVLNRLRLEKGRITINIVKRQHTKSHTQLDENSGQVISAKTECMALAAQPVQLQNTTDSRIHWIHSKVCSLVEEAVQNSCSIISNATHKNCKTCTNFSRKLGLFEGWYRNYNFLRVFKIRNSLSLLLWVILIHSRPPQGPRRQCEVKDEQQACADGAGHRGEHAQTTPPYSRERGMAIPEPAVPGRLCELDSANHADREEDGGKSGFSKKTKKQREEDMKARQTHFHNTSK